MVVLNRSKEGLILKIDPALIFEPEDTAYQDLILSGEELLFVKAGDSNSMELQTYCGKSYANSPQTDLAFSYKTQGDSNMIAAFNYARTIGANIYLTQQAVWFMTDKNKNLASVYVYNQQKESQKLMLFLANKYGYEIPIYRLERNINSNFGEIAGAGMPLKLHVDLEWQLNSPEVLNLAIFNEDNQKIATYFEGQSARKRNGKITASFETSSYPKGNYFVRLYNDSGIVIKEVMVPLE
ncbi:MAG TPA: hypothetical protein VLZ83_17080 [Edaphocola sp.]|nr:hypothetical protein [Edaphocola sp.]